MSPSHVRARGIAATGALSLVTLGAGTVAATAQTTPVAAAPTATPAAAPTVTAKLHDRHVRYGRSLTVSGRVSGAPAGSGLELEHRAPGGSWTRVAKATAASDGTYRMRAKATRNGALRVVVVPGAGQALRASAAAAPASSALSVRVAAAMRTSSVRRHVDAGRSTVVRGRVLPAGAGRTVRLQVRTGKGWRTVDRDRTSKSGAYRVAYRTSRPGRLSVRVRVAGDRGTTSARRTLGRVNVYRLGHASWYGPGFYGNRTACGQTLGGGTLGVAHKTLPCGTKVTFRYRGRSVTVPVIDRGPFIAGREWDLTGATKAALGFGSTGTVRSTR